jgi:NAD-dependent dihydropyrimidine dehydrogenase PreA subunit
MDHDLMLANEAAVAGMSPAQRMKLADHLGALGYRKVAGSQGTETELVETRSADAAWWRENFTPDPNDCTGCHTAEDICPVHYGVSRYMDRIRKVIDEDES